MIITIKKNRLIFQGKTEDGVRVEAGSKLPKKHVFAEFEVGGLCGSRQSPKNNMPVYAHLHAVPAGNRTDRTSLTTRF